MENLRKSSFRFLLALCLQACAITQSSTPEQQVNRCAMATDCELGSVCSSDHVCLRNPETPYQVSLEVSLSNDGAGQSVPPFLLTPLSLGAADVDLGDVPVVQGVPVIGTVTFGSRHVTAELIFETSEQRFETRTLPENDSREEDFAVRLNADAEYRVTVRPQGSYRSLLPPLTAGFRPGNESTRLNIQYPEDLTSFRGLVVDPDKEPQVGVTVVALNEDGIVISSAVDTDANGKFELKLLPGNAPTTLRVTGSKAPGESLTGVPAPSSFALRYDVSTRFLLTGQTGEVELLAPRYPSPVAFRGRVVRADDSSQGVPFAVVALSTTGLSDVNTGISAQLDTSIVADSMGNYSIALFPGQYSYSVTSPRMQDLGSKRGEHLLTDSEATRYLELNLPLRSLVQGEVHSPGDRLLAGARLRLIPTDARDQEAFEVDTDSSGFFFAYVDPGNYNLVGETPMSSRFGWFVDLARNFTASSANIPLDLRISSPARVRGKISFGSVPLASGEVTGQVRAFATMRNGANIEIRVPVGVGNISQGRFELYLPSRLRLVSLATSAARAAAD